MRVLFQPTQQAPEGWRTTDSALWSGLERFTCHALCVQGVTFDGADHYSVQPLARGGIRVAVWYDDPDDWPPGHRWARVVTFRPVRPDPDPRFGGAFNTRQTHQLYFEPEAGRIIRAAYAGNPSVTFHRWATFDPSAWAAPMPGQWVSEVHHEAHRALQAPEGWRTWVEGLAAAELDASGRLSQQRAQGRYEIPRGTRTYFHNNVALTTGAHVANVELELGLAAAGAASVSSGNIGIAGELAFASSTPAGEPDSAAWPTTGVYRHQMDVTTAGVDLIFGLLTTGAGAGHFGRVDSALAADLQSFTQAEAAFIGSGLHLATVTNPAWTAGAAGDRFEIVIASQKTAGHGSQTFTMELGESDDFADGPWAAAAAPSLDNAPLFGTVW